MKKLLRFFKLGFKVVVVIVSNYDKIKNEIANDKELFDKLKEKILNEIVKET